MVTSTADSGAGTLRQALVNANASAVAGIIDFNIGTGPQTINLNLPLPEVTVGITIDATTQPGYAGEPDIELDGSGLILDADSNLVRGLALDGFGTGVSGSPGAGVGIWLKGDNNVVTGNYIGIDLTGEMAPGNAQQGILVSGADNTVGGTTAGAGNVISGLSGVGITISGPNSINNLVEGNFIGTDATGQHALANAADGIDVSSANTIGGTEAGAGNVICACAQFGISGSDGDVIQGNFIGTNANGASGLGNGVAGILIPGGASDMVGGTASGAGNVISGNADGIEIIGGSGSIATANTIEDNLIGLAPNGQTALGNSSHGVLIGAVTPPSAGNDNDIIHNTIADNGGPGVDVRAGSGNFISRDSFFGNAGLGIDLEDNGVNPITSGPSADNDPNYPAITSISSISGTTTIQGALTGRSSIGPAGTSYTLEFYCAPAADPSNFVEGKTYLGSITVTTDETNNATFSFTTSAPATLAFTATATDANDDTSEFSQAQVIGGVPVLHSSSVTTLDEDYEETSLPSTTVTLTGANFTTGAAVYFKGTSLTTRWENVTNMQALIPVSLLTQEGTFSLYIVNAGTGGGTSNALTITVLTTLPDGTRGTANERFVAQLYRDLLNRDVDSGGLVTWSAQLDQGVAPSTIIAQIEKSTEYLQDEVNALYSKYLHRAADPTGLGADVQLLENGATIEQVAANIIGSQEYFQDRGQATDATFLAALYEDALGRAIDSGGQSAWTNALNAGVTRSQVAADILASTEYRGDFVNATYLQFLERSADPGGLASWVAQLASGLTDQGLIAAIAGSAEYFNLTSR
jgi:hypothetical protein